MPLNIRSVLKPLCFLNKIVGSPISPINSKYYQFYWGFLLIGHVNTMLFIIASIWSIDKPLSTKMIKCASILVKTSIIMRAILNSNILKKKNILKLQPLVLEIEFYLNHHHRGGISENFDIIFGLFLFGTCLIHNITSSEDNSILNNFEDFQLVIVIVTSLKFLVLTSQFFDQINRNLGAILLNQNCQIQPFHQMYKKINRVLVLWNDLYGVELLQIFLYVLIVLIDNIINLILEFERSSWWKLMMMSWIIIAHLVWSLFLSKIGYDLSEKTKLASKIILKGLIRCDCGVMRDDLKLLLLKLITWGNLVSAADYFTLDYSFFLSLLTAIVGYIVILIELK